MSLNEMVGFPTLDLTRFDRAADIIEAKGFWDGTGTQGCGLKRCLGLALMDAVDELERDGDSGSSPEVDYLARQLGYTGPADSALLDFIFAKNDEFAGRPEEGQRWAVDTLRRLARGESLV